MRVPSAHGWQDNTPVSAPALRGSQGPSPTGEDASAHSRPAVVSARGDMCNPPRQRVRRSGSRNERGQALIEFALVLPVLMLIVLGIIKGGALYNNYLQLTDAVRSGDRQLAIERGQTSPCGDAANEAIGAAGSD